MSELSLKETQAIITDILKDIDDFCRRHSIRYSLAYGTMLGAVRHRGFIPWDDDADIFMLREDFDRFIKEYKSNRYHLLFQPGSKEKFIVSGYAKVCDPTTKVINHPMTCSYGVFVDIFPLDFVPENPKTQHERMHLLRKFTNRLYHRQKKDLISIIKSHGKSLEKWWEKCNETIHSEEFSKSPLVAHGLGAQNYKTILPVKWFDNLKEISFEGHNFMGFSETDKYLSMVYGTDYMTPPPPEERINHGDRFEKLISE